MNPESSAGQNSNVIRIIVVVALILIAGGAVAYSVLGKKMTAPVTTAQAAAATTSADTSGTPALTVSPSTTTSTYKDGTYSATGSYLSPGGNEKIGVQLTLKNDIVTAASVTPEPVSSEGQEFQAKFKSGFQAQVVGKDISSIHLTHVSGSSLTPGGFNDAVAQIEAQAKA